ncbi:NAD dependent epimerase/dehydratase family protein [Asticcacaulis biprosthecium C19]|uniref:NAD dependent epimerase/dehydratase family protein n=1 Tax=Asticcacaulis biprosthecium C19 TaxID=715226 RepID=F4QLL4_9CAUL|nr:NAD-dependent epimerase/dehydratase family protein [Asticcacaulis biprosthecium]EGF93512.1 NAD dependent epimerase/dehydratase family protein [Asticcacaulis biprosthecium C19]
MKTVLVLGARGGIGQAVAQAFRRAGWRVLGLVRSGGAGEGIAPIHADLFDAAAVATACGSVDIVFNGLNVPYPVWSTQALPMYEAAADVAQALGARHIYPGSVYNFGARMPLELSPQVPFAPTTVKGRIRVEIEAMLGERAEAGRVKTIVLRAGDVFGGPARNSWMQQLVAKDLAKGRIVSPGGYDVTHAWAYLPDLAETVVRLAQVEESLGAYEVFHFDGNNASMRELARAAGPNVKLSRMPRFVFSVMGLFDPFMKATIEMLYLWDVPHALLDDRLAQVIGPVPHTPLERALTSIM